MQSCAVELLLCLLFLFSYFFFHFKCYFVVVYVMALSRALFRVALRPSKQALNEWKKRFHIIWYSRHSEPRHVWHMHRLSNLFTLYVQKLGWMWFFATISVRSSLFVFIDNHLKYTVHSNWKTQISQPLWFHISQNFLSYLINIHGFSTCTWGLIINPFAIHNDKT